jgi:hypothetical protein
MRTFKIKGALIIAVFAMLTSCQTEQMAIEDTRISEIDTQGIGEKQYYYKGTLLTNEDMIAKTMENSYGAIETDGKVEIYDTENECKAAIKKSEISSETAKAASRGHGVVFGVKGYNKSNKQSLYGFFVHHSYSGMSYSTAVVKGVIGLPNGKPLNNAMRHDIRFSTLMGLENRINIVNHNNSPKRIQFNLLNPSTGAVAQAYFVTVKARGSLSIYSNQTKFNMNANGTGGLSNRRAYQHYVLN